MEAGAGMPRRSAMRRGWWIAVAVGLVIAAGQGLGQAARADETADVLAKLDTIAAQGEKADEKLRVAVVEGIARNRAAVAGAILPRLADRNVPEKQLAVYVWALGLTRDPGAVDPITRLYRESASEMVRGNCLFALGTIGGDRAGAALVSALDGRPSPDEETRFGILNLLAQMQYEPALPRMESVLRQDPKKYYWQSILVFGKMDDKAVPLLLRKINDPDKNVRNNAIRVLGQWLISLEAVRPLVDRYWVEQEPELRGLILSSLERVVVDMEWLKGFFGEVAQKERDPRLAKYARETLGKLDKIREETLAAAKVNPGPPEKFRAEYAKLYRSAGKQGSYETLAECGSVQDEPALKSLRRRILQRDSDEAFSDYQQVNAVIIQHRLLDYVRRAKDEG